MIIPRLEYYGDIKKAQALKGAALQFFSFCCLGIGEALTLNKTKKLNDTTVIQAIINKDPYGNLFGIVKIYVASSGGFTPAVLFCTSFNAGDDGTQVYKKPYPPITQGDLITLNPQTTPYPDYSARSNFRNNGNIQSYWVNKKETEVISWSYETFYFGGYKKAGKISIQGLETDIYDFWYYEPLYCALLEPTEDNPTPRFVMIFRDRVNFTGTGTTRYCNVYDYVLNTDLNVLQITQVSSFNLTNAGYGNKTLYGIMSDAKTLIFESTNSNARTLNYLVFSDNYLSIIETDDFFTETPADILNNVLDSEMWFPIIDIRDKVRFITYQKYDFTTQAESDVVDGYSYTALQKETNKLAFHKLSWSKESSLSKSQFKNADYLKTITKTPDYVDGSWDGTFTTVVDITETNCYGLAHTKNDLIYSEYTNHTIDGNQASFTGAIKSQQAGTIMTISTPSHYIEDYSYTDDVFVGSFYDDDINLNRSWISAVLDYPNKSKKLLTGTNLKTLSVTKLPDEITP